MSEQHQNIVSEGTDDMAIDSSDDDESFTDATDDHAMGDSAQVPPMTTGMDSGGVDAEFAIAAKRRAIQAIMRDGSLSELEKRMRIQSLMDGTQEASSRSSSSAVPGIRAVPPSQVVTTDSVIGGGLGDDSISCVHYERKCNIVAPCCDRIFGCRICHDEMTPSGHGPMDRFAIREVVCKECNTRQPTSNQCINCGVTFGEYHCSICNLWMAQSKRPFHCHDCGFCRVGGRDAFRHCHQCCMCISVNVYNDHNCMKDKYKNNCPVCREDMFSSRQSPQDLPCGHAIHAHCFRKLAGFDYRCPICKKTVVSQQSMAAALQGRGREI
mmetsp:Transcript_19118/g.28561  ORF Transcript_19118/g.28561 Transcript_19118/m.28561 type:complete len:325 (-) Transcript_19118:3-977(-)